MFWFLFKVWMYSSSREWKFELKFDLLLKAVCVLRAPGGANWPTAVVVMVVTASVFACRFVCEKVIELRGRFSRFPEFDWFMPKLVWFSGPHMLCWLASISPVTDSAFTAFWNISVWLSCILYLLLKTLFAFFFRCFRKSKRPMLFAL